jgi:hypothetical protein
MGEILDQFGKPFRPGRTFLTPAWVMREANRIAESRAADARAWALRLSIDDDDETRAGTLIHVRAPKRDW